MSTKPVIPPTPEQVCCRLNKIEKTIQYQSDDILTGSQSGSAMTTNTNLDINLTTLTEGRWIIIANGSFSLTGATSTKREMWLSVGGSQVGIQTNLGTVTTITDTENIEVTTVVDVVGTAQVKMTGLALFSAGSIMFGGGFRAVRIG